MNEEQDITQFKPVVRKNCIACDFPLKIGVENVYCSFCFNDDRSIKEIREAKEKARREYNATK